MNGIVDAPLGALSFLSFGLSVIAAVLAIDMYRLLRTGEFGQTWRLLIIASVMMALLQVLRMAEVFEFDSLIEERLAQIVELCFIITLAYAFYCQRKVFTRENDRNLEMETHEESIGDDDDDVDDWQNQIDVTEDEFVDEEHVARSHHAAQF